MIVGAGIAGLATAVRLRQEVPEVSVTVVAAGAGNSAIAGQRYRTRAAGGQGGQLVNLLAARNGGVMTENMAMFARTAPATVGRWLDFDPGESGIPLPPLAHADRPAWFGPQLGDGRARGASVVRWLRQVATGLGADVRTDTVLSLAAERTAWAMQTRTGTLRARHVVLCNGSPGGALFDSTNVDMSYSAAELAIAAGLAVTCSGRVMLHPFGALSAGGAPRKGCYETDLLAGGTVWLRGKGSADTYSVRDDETTELLAAHRAHEQFPAIAHRFAEHGGTALVTMPDGRNLRCRVAHHYSHLAVDTTDVGRVAGARNLYAAGDAAGVDRWAGHGERLPGVALTNCLLSAETVAWSVAADVAAGTLPCIGGAPLPARPVDRARLRQINTFHLLKDSGRWLDALRQLPTAPLVVLSAATALARESRVAPRAVTAVALRQLGVLGHDLANDGAQDVRS